MTNYFPFELQLEIIKRLPVKALAQFRSVSKRWKALIDSSEFINAYSVRETHLQRLLVWYEDGYVSTRKQIVSFIDDETLKPIIANQEIDPTTLGFPKLYKDLRVVGSSQGLFCFYDTLGDDSSYMCRTGMCILWNPSIRKSVCVVVSDVFDWYSILGFGVCPITTDPTIVKITNVIMEKKDMVSVSVEVFTLSTGSWKIPTTKLPDKPLTVTSPSVTIDKFIYWFGFYGSDDIGYGLGADKLIMSFDMTTQEVSLIDLPNFFRLQPSVDFSISKVNESLVLVDYNPNNDKQVCDVWMMNHGDSNLCTKSCSPLTTYHMHQYEFWDL